MKPSLFFVLFLIIPLFNCQNQNLSPAAINAITTLNTLLYQDFDLSDICSLNTEIGCDATHSKILTLYLNTPTNTTFNQEFDNSIISLTDLTEFSVATSIVPYPGFWTDIQYLTNLKKLSFSNIYNVLPSDVGTYFPGSLNILSIMYIYTPVAETLFTKTNITDMSVGFFNGNSTPIFPSTISEPTAVQTWMLRTWDTIPTGENFVALKVLYLLIMNDVTPFTFNSFDTYPVVTDIYFQMDDSSLVVNEVTSVYNIPSLRTFRVWTGYKYNIPAGHTLNFNKVNNMMFQLDFYNADLSNLGSPAFNVSQNIGSSINFYNCTLNFNVIDISTFTTWSISGGTITGTIANEPSSSMSRVNDFSFVNSTLSGSIPQSFCYVARSFTLIGSQVTDIPSCLICDYNSTDPNNQFYHADNPGLNSITAQCPSLSITSSTPVVNTTFGYITITGVDLGWSVFDIDGNPLSGAQVLVGNSKIVFPSPTGTGLGKQMQIRFHYYSLPLLTPTVLSFDYYPPEIYFYYIYSNGALNLGVYNLGPLNVTTLTVAGVNAPISSIQVNVLDTESIGIPYSDNATFSLTINVDGQESSQIFKPDNSQPKIDTPLTNFYYLGGYTKLSGQYLSFDSTIMNFTVNGEVLELYKAPDSNTVIYKTNALPTGNYSFVFNLLDYTETGYVTVSEVQPCAVVHGYCLGSDPVCVDAWTGPDCSSLPGNQTQPTMSSTSPQILNQKGSISVDGSLVSTFTYTFIPSQIRELNPFNEVINSIQPITYTLQQSGQYIYPINSNTIYYNLYTFFPYNMDSNNLYNQPQSFITSDNYFMLALVSYPFASTDNHLEFDYLFSLEITSPTQENCFYQEDGQLPIEQILNYHKLKINNIDLFITINRLNLIDTQDTLLPVNYRFEVVSQTTTRMNIRLTFVVPNFVQVTYLGLMFNVYYDEKSAKNEIGSVCVSTNNSTAPVQCKGSPQCSGNGQCVLGQCQCTGNWKGEICDGTSLISTPPVIDQDKPNSNTTSPTQPTLGLQISIIKIRELNYLNNEVRSVDLLGQKWYLNSTNYDQKQSYIYTTQVLDTSNITVKVDYYLKPTEVIFAGVTSIKDQGLIKYSAEIDSWPFLGSTNYIQVVFSAIVQDQSESPFTCSYKSVQYNEYDSNSVKTINIQINDNTFTGVFNDLAVIDSKNSKVQNVLLDSDSNDTNTKSEQRVGVNIQYFTTSAVIDPDFGLLVNYVDASDKEGSICQPDTSSKSKLTKAQIAGIVIGGAAFLAIIIISTIYYFYKRAEGQKLIRNIQNKISTLNGQQ